MRAASSGQELRASSLEPRVGTGWAAPHKPTYSQVFIGPFGDWTRTLSDRVQKWSEDDGSWTGDAWVQGPFTSPFNQSISYGRLVLVVTGIGLSAALPIVQQLMDSERSVFLVWLTNSKVSSEGSDCAPVIVPPRAA